MANRIGGRPGGGGPTLTRPKNGPPKTTGENPKKKNTPSTNKRKRGKKNNLAVTVQTGQKRYSNSPTWGFKIQKKGTLNSQLKRLDDLDEGKNIHHEKRKHGSARGG